VIESLHDSSKRLPMNQGLTRVIRGPYTAFRLFLDRICIPVWLRWLGVTCGQGCSFIGRPIITLAPGGTIALGEGVRVFSRANSNPAGLPHPTILAALTPESAITIGKNTAISGASIAARVKVTIGSHVMIGAGACIWDTDFHPVDPYKRHQHPTRDARCAPVVIQDDVFIGARAMILKGVTVGWGAVIGAGAVVTRNVEAGQVVAGNPAVVIGSSLRNIERVREDS